MVAAKRVKLHKGRRAVPGPDPRVDTLLNMVMALTSELSILRERLDAHESLAATGKPYDQAAVDNYEPSEADEARRAKMRERLLAKVCRPLQE